MFVTDIAKSFESGDFARTNLFEVEIPFLGRNFSIRCRAAPMPAGNVEPVIVSYQNRKIKVAGDRTFEDWTITAYNDDAHNTRQSVIDWQNMAHGQGDEITGDKPADYKKTATIRQIGRDGKTVTKEHVIYGLWPSVVGEVQLDWDQNNEVETFEITFAYDWWL